MWEAVKLAFNEMCIVEVINHGPDKCSWTVDPWVIRDIILDICERINIIKERDLKLNYVQTNVIINK